VRNPQCQLGIYADGKSLAGGFGGGHHYQPAQIQNSRADDNDRSHQKQLRFPARRSESPASQGCWQPGAVPRNDCGCVPAPGSGSVHCGCGGWNGRKWSGISGAEGHRTDSGLGQCRGPGCCHCNHDGVRPGQAGGSLEGQKRGPWYSGLSSLLRCRKTGFGIVGECGINPKDCEPPVRLYSEHGCKSLSLLRLYAPATPEPSECRIRFQADVLQNCGGRYGNLPFC